MERSLVSDSERYADEDVFRGRRINAQHQLFIKKNFQLFGLQICGLIFILIFLFYGNKSWWAIFPKTPPLKYGILIDAGSHGSRLHIYSWTPSLNTSYLSGSQAITIPKEIFSQSHSPGINSIDTGNISMIPQVRLKKLIEGAKEFLEKHKIGKWETIPIHLKATAGMRNVDALARSRIMNGVRKYLSNKTLVPFLFHRDWARVIAGEEEGVYGWIAVNNAHNTLFELPQRTYGALDLGGSSVQITFFPKHTSVLEDYYGLVLGEKIVRLYSHSYIGYGWDDALSRITTKLALDLIKNPKAKRKVVTNRNNTMWTFQGSSLEYAQIQETVFIKGSHPCYPLGSEIRFPLPSLVYPEGRFYIDIDYDTLRHYMFSIEIPREYHQLIINHGINHKNPVYTQVFNELSTDRNSTQHEFNTFNTSLPGLYNKTSSQILTQTDIPKSNENNKFNKHNSAHAFIPLDFPLPLQGAARRKFIIEFTGNSDIKECSRLAKSLFYPAPCFIHSCSFNGVYQPRLEDSKFIALGQMNKIQNALNLSAHTSLNELFRAASEICPKSRKELLQERREGRYPSFGKKGVMKLCWKTLWAVTLLSWGFGFPNNSQSVDHHLHQNPLIRNDNTVSPGWAIGSVIYEINRAPRVENQVKHFDGMILLVLSIVCFSISLYFSWKQLFLYQDVSKKVTTSAHIQEASALNSSSTDYVVL